MPVRGSPVGSRRLCADCPHPALPEGGAADRSGVECPDHPRTQLMALTVGTRLGHNDVTSLLGEGDLPPMVVPVLMRELDTFLRSQAQPA